MTRAIQRNTSYEVKKKKRGDPVEIEIMSDDELLATLRAALDRAETNASRYRSAIAALGGGHRD